MDKRLAMIISLGMAVLAAVLIHGYLNRVREQAYEGLERVKILVASTDIAAGDSLSAANVAFYEFPRQYVGDRAVMQEQANMVLGATALGNIERAQPIFWSDIHKDTLDLDQGLADLVEPGMRAVTIPITGASGLDGMLRSLQRVDLLFTFDLNQFMPTISQQKPQPSFDPSDIESLKRYYMSAMMDDAHDQLQASGSGKRTVVLFENLLIIAVGSRAHRGVLPQAEPEEASDYSTVTFMVTPEQANILAFCQGEGRFDLVLRRTGDLAPVPEETGMVSYASALEYIQGRVRQSTPLQP